MRATMYIGGAFPRNYGAIGPRRRGLARPTGRSSSAIKSAPISGVASHYFNMSIDFGLQQHGRAAIVRGHHISLRGEEHRRQWRILLVFATK